MYVTEFNVNETNVEHSGLYSCHVSLDTNRPQVTAEGNLTVACKYALLISLIILYNFCDSVLYHSGSSVDVHTGPSDGVSIPPVLGNNISLSCSVTLHPQLNPSILNIHYQWSSNGLPRGSGQELVLHNLFPADATSYSCQVTVSATDPGLLLRQISNVSSYVLMIKSELLD